MSRSALSREVLERLDHSATQVLLTTGITPAELREAGPDQLLSLQTQLLMGDTWGTWEVAAELISGGGVAYARRTYQIAAALPAGIDADSTAARKVWAELLRVAIAGRLWPGPLGRRMAYSTTHSTMRALGMITRRVEDLDQPGLWSKVTKDEVKTWSRNVYCNLLQRLHSKGVLADAPVGRKRPKGQAPARDRTGEAEHKSPAIEAEQWQPFPDAFTAEAGRCVLQMIEVVGPTLLDALEEAASSPVRTVNLDPRTSTCGQPIKSNHAFHIKAEALDPIIAKWKWRDPAGESLTSLPMTAIFSARGTGRFSWPPQTYAQACALLPLLQTCHMWPVALSSAGRRGEILSLTEGMIRREDTDTPTCALRTWKLDGVGGRDHEVPLPALVVSALNQQERLSRLIKRMHGVAGNHLWVMATGSPGHALSDFSSGLRTLVRTFNLTPLLEGGSAHMHRFRKTLVRMVALALVHAPKILMDVLGHRDEQMTVMRYILSDSGLLLEIQETVRELIVLKGVEAVEKRDRVQGRGAVVLRDRVASYAKRVGAKAMEPQNLLEFVRAMTEGGTGWAIIAPGIVCTGFSRGGLCNKGQGEANPDYCHPDCDNQLVMPEYEDGIKISSAVTHAIETMDYMLEKLCDADDSGEDMLIAQFSGQVKALLGRWREVDRHFSDHPVLKKHLPNVVLLP